MLKDIATPSIIREMILDISLAVTNEEAGKRAAALMMKSLADFKHTGRIRRPRQEFLDLLHDLRRSRGDLYDAFHEALGASFTAVICAHTPGWERSKLALTYDVSGADRSATLSLAEALDAALSRLRPGGDNGHQTACA